MNRIYKIGLNQRGSNYSEHFVDSVRKFLAAFDLPVFQFHRSGATENRDRNTQFSALGIDFFDDSGLILEWAVGDFHRFTNLEAHFWLHLFFPLLHLR